MTQWQEQFGELARARYRGLVAYARLLTGDPESAQDLVHDALVRVFGKTRRFPTTGHAEAYVKRAIASIFIDGRRHDSRTLRLFSRLADRDAAPDPSIAVDTSDEVHAALLTLSPRERACIVLRYFDDLDVAETSRVLEISVGATKRYLVDARLKLAARLDDLSQETTPMATVVTLEGRRAQ